MTKGLVESCTERFSFLYNERESPIMNHITFSLTVHATKVRVARERKKKLRYDDDSSSTLLCRSKA